jgi:DnaJ-domain-containing protein 1
MPIDPGIILLGLVGLSVAVLAGLFAYHYRRYRATPEVRWAKNVRGLGAQLDDRIRRAQREAAAIERDYQVESQRRREAAFHGYLESLSVERLADYPNIGAATVGRLQQNGLNTLGRLRKARINPSWFGPKRTADLKEAVKALLRDATSRFEAGACPEAQQAGLHLEALASQFHPRIAAARKQQQEAQEDHTRLKPVLEVADGVSFWRFFRKRPYPGLTPELLHTPVTKLVPPRPVPQPVVPAPTPEPPAEVLVPAHGFARVETAPRFMPSTLPAIAPVTLPAAPLDLFRSALETATVATVPERATHPRLPHLKLTAEFAFAIARVDGRIAAAERDTIHRYLQQTFGHESDLVRFINPLCEQYEKGPAELDDCLRRATQLFSQAEWRDLYDLAVAVADAAEKRNKKEEECLARLRQSFGIAEPQGSGEREPFEQRRQECRPHETASTAPLPEECRVVLEIPPNAPLSAELVRRHYRLLCERCDPAKFESHGPEFIEVARHKLQRAEAAARALLAPMGEPLELEAPPEEVKELRHNPDLDAIFG